MGYYDIQSDASGSEPSRPTKRSEPIGPPAGFQNLTPASWGVLVVALASVLFILANMPSGYEWRPGQWQRAVPHIAVVAFMLVGLRRAGDVTAVVLAVPVLALSFVVAGLPNLGDNHRENELWNWFAAMQAVMLLFAAHDLRNNNNRQSRPIKLFYRLLGLALPLVLLIVSCSISQRGGPR